jgi:hypothetical protein
MLEECHSPRTDCLFGINSSEQNGITVSECSRRFRLRWLCWQSPILALRIRHGARVSTRVGISRSALGNIETAAYHAGRLELRSHFDRAAEGAPVAQGGNIRALITAGSMTYLPCRLASGPYAASQHAGRNETRNLTVARRPHRPGSTPVHPRVRGEHRVMPPLIAIRLGCQRPPSPS